jgi:hypothetical protein
MNNENDMSLDTDERNAQLDAEILKGGEEIAGLLLRPISAGDLALLMGCGVGLVVGKTNNLMFDVGAILWTQSSNRDLVRKSVRDNTFSDEVFAFLDGFDPTLFQDATPRVTDLIGKMLSARTSIKGSASIKGGPRSKKAGNLGG